MTWLLLVMDGNLAPRQLYRNRLQLLHCRRRARQDRRQDRKRRDRRPVSRRVEVSRVEGRRVGRRVVRKKVYQEVGWLGS